MKTNPSHTDAVVPLKVVRQVRIADVVHFDHAARDALADAVEGNETSAMRLCQRLQAGFETGLSNRQHDVLRELRDSGFELVDY